MFRVRLLTAAGAALVENDAPEKADCVVALGGDDFGTRVVTAARLVQAGYAPKAFIDGTPSLEGYECDATVHYAVSKGFSLTLFETVPLPPRVDSTITEAEYVANNVLRRNNVHKVLLVTSNYHTRRAAHFFRKAAPWLQVVPVAAPDPFFTPGAWWKTRMGKKTFLLEWTKTITEWWGS